MDDTLIDLKLDFKLIKKDLIRGIHNCSQRGLYHCVKWLAEINVSLQNVVLSSEDFANNFDDLEVEVDNYFLAKSFFDLKEYDRCSHFVKNCVTPKGKFLYFYSRYLAIEKKKLEDYMIDTNSSYDPIKDEFLIDLCTELKTEHFNNKLDGFCLYLYAVILKKLDLIPAATEAFIKAVNSEPMLWSAWYELGKIIQDKNAIFSSSLPDHWMKYFFLGHAYLEQLNNNESLQIYNSFYSLGFQNCTYILSQIALGHHNRRDLNEAIKIFQTILEIDPYRLDNLDIYSNLLYVQEKKKELAVLAHKVVTIDKYRVETCCVIGNYYSLRSDHAKAVLYFRRALKLNPQFLSAWTLMGHEYMEMKNTNAAIQSYRHAIEINSRDYRAWYGLGQTYEILKMPNYCLYYYKRAQQLKPNDSRMMIALGEAYEKLEKTENAVKCYHKAYNLGDVEGTAILKLAKLYDKLSDVESAATAFTEYCLREENKMRCVDEQSEFYNALQYLANFHLKKGELDDAYTYAFKCLECEETKEVAKSILKSIASKRAELDAEPNRLINETNATNIDMVFSPNPL